MFLWQDEIAKAASLFASKFADILCRRVVLYGSDPFALLLSRRFGVIASSAKAPMDDPYSSPFFAVVSRNAFG